MSLQLSLLLIGLISLAAVVLVSYDRARLNKRFAEMRRRHASARGIVHQALSKVERKFRAYARLDINPGPLTETHRKFLRADARADSPPLKPDVDPFFEDLESIERVDRRVCEFFRDGGDLEAWADTQMRIFETPEVRGSISGPKAGA